MSVEQHTTWWDVQQPRGEPRDVIWLRSTGGTLLAILLGLSNMIIVQRQLPDLGGAFVAVAVGGIIAGAVQGGFMRRYTQPAPIWLLITASGWVAAFIALRLPDWWQLTSADLPVSRVLFCASLVSVPQWWMLRRSVGRAWCWVLINICCWCAVLVTVSVFLQ